MRKPLRHVFTRPKRLSCGRSIASALRLIVFGKAFCCECACVFEQEVSIQVIEFRIVGALIRPAVMADRIRLCFLPMPTQHPVRIERPCYVEELDRPSCHCPSPLAHRAWKQTGYLEFQPITVPLVVGLVSLFGSMEIVDFPQAYDRRVCLHRRRKRKATKHQQDCCECHVQFFHCCFSFC